MTRVIALDPGGTTGWAFTALSAGKIIQQTGQLGPGPHHKELWQLMNSFGLDVIVCEDFRYRQQANAVLVSVEYIGVVNLYSQVKGVRVVKQGSDVIHGGGPWDDNALRKSGFWIKGKRHANDAQLHLLHYLAENSQGPRMRHLYAQLLH